MSVLIVVILIVEVVASWDGFVQLEAEPRIKELHHQFTQKNDLFPVEGRLTTSCIQIFLILFVAPFEIIVPFDFLSRSYWKQLVFVLSEEDANWVLTYAFKWVRYWFHDSTKQWWTWSEASITEEKVTWNDANYSVLVDNLQLDVHTLEKRITRWARSEVGSVMATVETRVHEAMLTALESLVSPRVELAMTSVNTSSGRDIGRVVLNADQ